MAKKSKQVKKAALANSKDVSDGHFSGLMINGLSDLVFGFGPNQQPSAPLSQVGTIFYNMRWYLISNMRQPLSQAYAEIALIQTICNIPVDDGLRGGIDIATKQLDEDQISLLQAKMEREGDLGVVASALYWNRLFGGAGILTLINGADNSKPFDVKKMPKGTKVKFRSADMWELFFDQVNVAGDGSPIYTPFQETYNYYGKNVHESRIMPMKGIEPPSFIKPRLRGWGLSIVDPLVRSLNQYLKATDLGFEVLDEFKLDIFKIKGLSQALMSSSGTQKIQERVALANAQKNFQNALTMDMEDDYIQKQLSWSGLAEAMDGIRKQIASDMRIPMIKLFGQAAGGGLGNTGEDEIEVYNSMVESQIRSKCKFDILKIVEIRCQELFGLIPEDLEISFQPLRVLSAVDEETVKTGQFNRLLQARQAGEITALEFRDSANRDNLFAIKLETDPSIMAELETERANAQAMAQGDQASDAGEDDNGDKDDTGNDDRTETLENSLEYDKASYETDGGDEQFSEHHERDLENPDRMPDRSLIARGEQASRDAFGSVKWQFVYWFYKQHGGILQ